jgi:Rod binding domain-containing protein
MEISSIRAGSPANESVSATRKAALGFEQLLVKQLVAELAKSAQPEGDDEAASATSDVYRSMLPDALTDAISKAGGLGLADSIEKGIG